MALLLSIWKRLLTGTVPVNKAYLTGAVPVNKANLTSTVPMNKVYLTGTVTVNKAYLTVTLLNSKTLEKLENNSVVVALPSWTFKMGYRFKLHVSGYIEKWKVSVGNHDVSSGCSF